jgi:hypothetical protein
MFSLIECFLLVDSLAKVASEAGSFYRVASAEVRADALDCVCIGGGDAGSRFQGSGFRV